MFSEGDFAFWSLTSKRDHANKNSLSWHFQQLLCYICARCVCLLITRKESDFLLLPKDQLVHISRRLQVSTPVHFVSICSINSAPRASVWRLSLLTRDWRESLHSFTVRVNLFLSLCFYVLLLGNWWRVLLGL